jgi:hypothetical protein
MQTVFKQDNSYFTINILGGLNASANIIDISITEEIQKFVTGSISFLDPSYYFTNEFRSGTKFQIAWGYKNRSQTLEQANLLVKNPTELTTQGVRRGQNCIVTTPSWAGSTNGQIVYTCQFIGGEKDNNTGKKKTYMSGTKYSVINQIFDNLKITNKLINFSTMNNNLNTESYHIQNETDFKFLLNLSYEWRCTFKIGYDQTGNLCGIFVDNTKVGSSETKAFIMQMTGGVGSNKLFEYGIGSSNPNVSSWNATQHIGDNGLGDGLRVDMIDGKPVFTRYVVEQDSIKAYRLDEQKVKKFAEANSQNSNEILSKALSPTANLDTVIWETTKVKDFFTPEIISTAPQGLGFTINMNVIGDTAFTPYVECKFGNGFPPPLRKPRDIDKIFLKKITHNLNEKGYMCALEAADIITSTGSYVQ